MQLARCGKLLGIPVRPVPHDCSRDRKLASEYQGRLKFCKFDAGENRQTATQYQGMTIRMLVFFKDGVPERDLGAVSDSVLGSKVELLLRQQ